MTLVNQPARLMPWPRRRVVRAIPRRHAARAAAPCNLGAGSGAGARPGARGLLRPDRDGHVQQGCVHDGREGLEGRSNFTLDDLEVQRTLGSGASSTVRLVKDRVSGELMALKELNVMCDQDTMHMTINEIKILHKAHSVSSLA
ncbi:hypothetical protein T492DRAFT_1148908 [Pavlovales sp. CCMP2436]|nr:hypothetical protein T492DRAFT_1148908 [Pavlovales sp. CCMP2436]